MAKPRFTECLIGVDFANALNQFLYKAGMHKDAYLKMGFDCPYCHKPVKPRLKSKSGTPAHFAHRKVDARLCPGPSAE